LLALGTDAALADNFQVLPGQRVLLQGDSIVRGHAFGNYTDPSPLRTIYGIANLLLQDNLSHPPPMAALPGVWAALNPDGTPKTVDTLADEIRVHVRAGQLRPGDWLIYEDAGELNMVVHPAPWPDAVNMYARQREALRGLLAGGGGSLLFTGATASLRGRGAFVAFAAAKAGLRSLAQSLAREYGPRGVHVAHVVIDGGIDGERLRTSAPQRAAEAGADGLLAPEAIAETYWQLHQQHRSAWTQELDLRPYKESF